MVCLQGRQVSSYLLGRSASCVSFARVATERLHPEPSIGPHTPLWGAAPHRSLRSQAQNLFWGAEVSDVECPRAPLGIKTLIVDPSGVKICTVRLKGAGL